MAIVKPGEMQAESDEMTKAFDEDIPAPSEQSEDEAFGLTPPDQAGGETPSADTSTATTESGAGEELPPEDAGAAPEAAGGGEELPAEPDMAAEESSVPPEDEQRAKSWEGRLRPFPQVFRDALAMSDARVLSMVSAAMGVPQPAEMTGRSLLSTASRPAILTVAHAAAAASA